MLRVWAFLCTARRFFIPVLICILAVVVAAGRPSPALAQDVPIVAKSFGAASIRVGASTSLTIRIQGLDRLTGVALTDSLPEGLVVATPNGLTETCQGAFATVAAAPGSNSISLAGGTIEAGTGCEFSLHVTGVTAGAKTNSVAATSDQGPGKPASASIVVERAATTTTIVSSANPSAAGQALTLTSTVTGSGGTPTGTVTFQDGSTTLGTANLSAAGTATYSTSTLSAGSPVITAVYGGDAAFAGSTSLVLTQVVDKARTRTTVTSSANPSAARQSVTFTTTVTGPSGTPTGTVTFLDGPTDIGSATLSAGSAILTASGLAVGHRSITAAYGGDLNFAASTSSPFPQTVQPEPAAVNTLQSGAILVIVIATVAFLLLVRRIAFLIVARTFRTVFRPVIRALRAVTRRIGRFLRLLRIISPARPPKPGLAVGSVVTLSGGTLARVFAGGTETDEAIAKDFDTALVPIDRTSQIFCTWLAPVTLERIPYDRKRAELDQTSAEHFFNTDIKLETNPLNLYEDIDGAFIVGLFRHSDKRCFYVLSEFRKTINANVLVLSVLFSVIVSVVAVVNVLLLELRRLSRPLDLRK